MNKDKKKEKGEKGTTDQSSANSSRTNTPRQLGKGRIQYSAERLKEINNSTSFERPKCLSEDYNTEDGLWDPEQWFQKESASKKTTASAVESSKDASKTRKPSGSLNTDAGSDGGIVLCPQRKSFTGGCQVSTRRIESPQDSEGRERGGQNKRIGSGRIAIDRDRDRERDREYNQPRGRFERDRDRIRDRDDRFSDLRDRDRDRGFRRDDRRDDRDNYRDRDFGGGSGRRYRNMDHHHHHHEEEPEWFSGGPTSQNDTIELRGFEQPSENKKEEEKDNSKHKRPGSGSLSSTDRNGSVETNESSSPEATPVPEAEQTTPAAPAQPNTGFDIGDLFKIEIPNFQDSGNMESKMAGVAAGGSGGGGSRFCQWFTPADAEEDSANGSRRSSINGEFNYLQEMIGGNKSAATVPSPPLGNQSQLPNFGGLSLDNKQSQQNIFELLQAGMPLLENASLSEPLAKAQEAWQRKEKEEQQVQKSVHVNGHVNTADLGKNLKALLSGKSSGPVMTGISPALSQIPPPMPGKVMSVAELEAGMGAQPTNEKVGQRKGPRPKPPNIILDPTDDAKALQVGDGDGAKLNMADPNTTAVFQKLLQMLTGGMEAQKMQDKVDPAQSQLDANVLLNQQKELAQKIVQQQLQHKQQQARLQQQQIQEHLMNLVKPKPPASPIPPHLGLQAPPPASPRCASPVPPAMMSQLLPAQPPTSPRAPSPIMFGSQPPMHLAAPSPIHPANMNPQALSPSPNTLQVQQGNLGGRVSPRLFSPQELVMHTQAIMQSALIKKQLEDQKERWAKKQQQDQRCKSPNPLSALFQQAQQVQQAQKEQGMVTTAMENAVKACQNEALTIVPTAATSQSKVPVSQAFTPTSVIRKMAEEKAEEERIRDPHGAKPPPNIPNLVIQLPDSESESGDTNSQFEDMISVNSEGDGISIRVPTATQSLSNNLTSVAQQLQALAKSHGAGDAPKQPRPLMGQGNKAIPNPANPQSSQVNSQPMGGRPIVKGQQQQPGQQRAVAGGGMKPDGGQRPIVGGSQANPQQAIDLSKLLEQQRLQQQLQAPPSPNLPRSVPMAARVNPNAPGAANNALFMQRMMQQSSNQPRNLQPMNAAMNQFNIAALHAQAAQVAQAAQAAQAQQRNVDPRLQAANRAVFGGQNPQFANNSLNPNMAAANMGRALSPSPMGPNLATLAAARQDLNGPMSPGISRAATASPNVGGLLGNHMDASLAKWFGTDTMKQQMGVMPPLPRHTGQTVLTLEEIERCQQTVTN